MFFEGHRVEKKRRCCENNASIFHRFFHQIFIKNRCKIEPKTEKSARGDTNRQKNGPGEPRYGPGRDFGPFLSPGRGLKMALNRQKEGN